MCAQSPGPTSTLEPSSNCTAMRPETTYPKCSTRHESVPAIGFTHSLHFQPGSNVPRPTSWPLTSTTSRRPLSNVRVSSGGERLRDSAMGGPPEQLPCPQERTVDPPGPAFNGRLPERTYVRYGRGSDDPNRAVRRA